MGALERREYLNSEAGRREVHIGAENFNSVDPAPASLDKDLDQLRKTLLDNSASLFDRYRAMFSLRNINTPESARVLGSALRTGSALFRHEVGYVLGQMENDTVVAELHLKPS